MISNTLRTLRFIVLTAIISALMLFAVSAENVVYLKDGGTGNGSSPDSAVDTLTKAHNALDLTADDATIVVCGPYTQSVNWIYGAGEYTGTVTFTSVYGGVDYRESADAVYNIGKCRFMCLGNNKFENMNINCTGEYCLLVGQHYDVTIGEGVVITGESLLGTAIANSFTIVGGYQEGVSLATAESTANTNVTVLSGSYLYIVPFSRGIENGKFTGTANITVGGNANVSVLHGSSANSDGVTLGNVKVTLKDSAIVDKFYGCTDNVTVNSYTFNYSGGTINEFDWVCPHTPDKELTVTGTKKLVVGGDVGYHALMDEFDTISGGDVAFLKDGGTGDGSNLANAADTLKEALAKLDLTKDCTVVICGPFTQTSDFAYGKFFTGKLTFTSVWNGVDYRTVAGANWQFDGERFACYGDTTFENIDFVSLGDNYTVAAQHQKFTIGEGVTVSGDNLSATTLATSFCIFGSYVGGFGNPVALNKNDINVTVLSGSKIYIVPFSYNVQGTYKGTANITIGGSANIGVLHGSCVGATDRKLGDLRVTVKDDAIVNRFYGATSEKNIVNSVEFFFESGRIYNFKWSTSTSTVPSITNPTVMRVSDKAMASQYYAAIAGNFDVVISSADVDTDVVPSATAEEEKARLDAIAGSRAYTAISFASGDDKPQVSLKLPTSGATNGNLYRIDGDYIITLQADAIGNGHMGFDLTEDGTYICSDTDFITYGDVDNNGSINVVDTLLTLKIVLGDNTIEKAAADVDDNQQITFIDVLRQLKMVAAADKPAEEFTFNPDDYNIISVDSYLDKTKLGFLSQMVGFLSGYEFARDPVTNLPMLAMADSYFEMCNGAYADPKEINLHGDKHLLNEETGIWEVWNDDDFSIDILDQYILRDSFAQYGTLNTKVITDDWLKYDVYDMGGGNRDIGAYGLMKNYRYLSVFSGNTEMCNNFNVNGEPYIGNETLGMNAAGMPDLAVDLAHNFGMTTSDRDPVEWLRMFAAMYSMAYFENDIPTLIRTAQEATMTKGSWPYEVVDACFELYEKHPDDWRAAIIEADKIFRSYNYDNPSYMGCTSINCSFIILGLLYGDGDYYDTCKIISLAGHGGDSTTPTALGVVGVITGWENLDTTSKNIINTKVWQDGKGIIVNRPLDPDGSYGTWMHMQGAEERFKISDLIDMYQANFENLLYENGGFKLNGNYYIPKQTISKVDTVYTEHFENDGIADYKVSGGTIANAADPFMGANALELTAGNGASTAYRTVSGLTVGTTYKLSAFIRTADGVTAHLFVRESGDDIADYVTVHDSNVYVKRFTVGVGENDMCSYVKRELVFTATAETMEIGLMLPTGTVSGGSAAMDAIEVIRFEETQVADVTVNGAKDENGAYSGLVRFDIDGGSKKEAWLKLTYASNATALEKAFTCVNRSWQSRTPIVPTNGGKVTIYIPVLVNNDTSNLITMYFDGYDVTIHEAELVMPQSRF
ncbi:MAG: ADP-ribosylglycohydrolase family protein [Clostridia bacterium]|nr:ADP-ribosylglycohydrolase family protein [Clostridia bacterium]